MTQKNKITETGVFVDVQGTLLKGHNILNQTLYSNMETIRKRGAKVAIFTMASPTSMATYLQQLGVNTHHFPVASKSTYRGHTFSGLIIDDLPPHLQGFIAQPNVYDPEGQILTAITQQLEKSPKLTFAQALKNYRITAANASRTKQRD